MGKDNYEMWTVWRLPRSIISHDVAGSSNQNKRKGRRPVILELSLREAGSGSVGHTHSKIQQCQRLSGQCALVLPGYPHSGATPTPVSAERCMLESLEAGKTN